MDGESLAVVEGETGRSGQCGRGQCCCLRLADRNTDDRKKAFGSQARRCTSLLPAVGTLTLHPVVGGAR